MGQTIRSSVTLSLLLLAACSTQQYRYVPTQNRVQSEEDKAQPEAIYPNVAGPASGDVRVFSMGIVTLKPREDSKNFPALDLRLVVHNQTPDQTWVLNGSDQSVSFPNPPPNEGKTPPVYVNSDSSELPSIEIKPGELRSVDLFFPLPQNKPEAKDIPAFAFNWKIQIDGQSVASSTPFDRQPVPEAPTVVYPYQPYLGFGWGPHWWIGPHPHWWY